jgi:hypothetical protein
MLRPSDDRGHANHGWLESHHSFSFAHYYDPKHMGYRSLRVINDDLIHPASGFPMHGHRDMEIITYVIEGGVSHRDTTGGAGVTRRGDVQVMTAGSGIRHSEFNASATESLRLLQIWILPEKEGLPPSYEQKTIPEDEKRNALRLVVGPNGTPDVLTIHQDLKLYASLLDANATVTHDLSEGRGAWIQVAKGQIDANGVPLAEGDGLVVEDVSKITIMAISDAEFLLFDLA